MNLQSEKNLIYNMTGIKIEREDISDFIIITNTLKRDGLVQGEDFSWAYYPPKWGQVDRAKHAVFTFRSEVNATMFALKWA